MDSIASWDPAPRLILVDTLAHCIAPGDESATRDMGAFVAAVNAVRRQTGAAVGVIHHTGWDVKRERGSTAFRGAVDTMIKVVMDEDKTITMSCDKQRDDAPFPDQKFVLEPYFDSCVLELASEKPPIKRAPE